MSRQEICQNNCHVVINYNIKLKKLQQKTVSLTRKISYDKPSACEKRWETFCKKRVMVKVDIPPAINKKTQEICQNNCHVVIIKYNRKIEKITITFQ